LSKVHQDFFYVFFFVNVSYLARKEFMELEHSRKERALEELAQQPFYLHQVDLGDTDC